MKFRIYSLGLCYQTTARGRILTCCRWIIWMCAIHCESSKSQYFHQLFVSWRSIAFLSDVIYSMLILLLIYSILIMYFIQDSFENLAPTTLVNSSTMFSSPVWLSLLCLQAIMSKISVDWVVIFVKWSSSTIHLFRTSFIKTTLYVNEPVRDQQRFRFFLFRSIGSC